MSDQIRVGILGCAQIAKRSLAPAFLGHPAFELVAIGSRSVEKARSFIKALNEQQLGCRARIASYDDLLRMPDVDLIYCPLPTGMHFEWVMRALKAGKHVLCEKSLGCNAAEVSDMVSAARDRKCFLMESFQFRFHAQNLYVKDLLRRNAIGQIKQLVVRFGVPPFPDGASNIRYSAELGGGALLDNGAYTVKCTTYLIGHDVEVLAAMEGCAAEGLGSVSLAGSIMMSVRAAQDLNPSTIHPVCVQTAYGFDHFYQNGYELWGTTGKISTARAFTARMNFAAPVVLETNQGREVKVFNDDHFARLMDYLAETIPSGDYEHEYQESLLQARILEDVSRMGRRK